MCCPNGGGGAGGRRVAAAGDWQLVAARTLATLTLRDGVATKTTVGRCTLPRWGVPTHVATLYVLSYLPHYAGQYQFARCATFSPRAPAESAAAAATASPGVPPPSRSASPLRGARVSSVRQHQPRDAAARGGYDEEEQEKFHCDRDDCSRRQSGNTDSAMADHADLRRRRHGCGEGAARGGAERGAGQSEGLHRASSTRAGRDEEGRRSWEWSTQARANQRPACEAAIRGSSGTLHFFS